MADPPATPAQGPPGDGRRAPPPAFAAAVGNPFSSPPQPVTPSPPPPLPSFSSSSRVGSSSEEKPTSEVVEADSEGNFPASPAETQESSNQAGTYSNADQRSDGKSYSNSSSGHGLSNGGYNVPMGPAASAVPMGPPPRSHFIQPPPHFASPMRPIPSFNAVASPGRSSSTFSEIPLVPGTPPTRFGTSPDAGNADLPLYHKVTEDEFDASSYSASTSFVLFSAQTVLKDKKRANAASLGFGCLVSPGRETTPGPPTLRRDGLRCRSCGAYVNLFCGIIPNSGHWRCSLCNKLNSSEGEYRSASSENIHDWPELVTSVVDYVDGGGTRRPGFISVSDSTMAAPIVILIDESLDDPHLQHLQSSLHSFLDSLAPATRIGIITFGRTVSVYDLSEMGLAAADVLPGDSSPDQELLKMLIYGTGVYFAPIHAGLSVAHNIISSLRPYRGDLAEAARDRCLGTAVEVALSLIQGPSTELPRSTVKRSGGSNRIIACVGGPNTLGVGALPYSKSHPNYAYLEKKAIKEMDHLGHEARRLDTAVDLLCAGTCPVRIPLLQPLAKASGGVLVLHDDFGETFGLNMQRAVRRASGFRGRLEVRCSSEVAVTRVIGPGEEARAESSEFRKDTCTAVQMLSIEDSQGFALSMELIQNITGDFVYFQFVARYTNVYQMQLTRVITVRLPTTGSPSTYLQSVDDDVAAVISAKKTVLLAEQASDLPDAQGSVHERVKDIALKFGAPVPKTKLWKFPKELPRLPELLYHLRRGPMLGSVVGHEDERAVYRSIFLQASFDLSLRMMAPRLLMHREGGTFEELPAYDIAMQSDTSLVMDHGTDLFIWMGMDVAADEARNAAALAACRTLAQELTEGRFPSPRILAFKEASSQARYLKSRLIAAHKDPTLEQEARFPQLRSLRPDQRARLKSSFVPTDELSFCEWMRSLKLVPPEPS
ncbi:unnamed protein product [Calypogeia fissa]